MVLLFADGKVYPQLDEACGYTSSPTASGLSQQLAIATYIDPGGYLEYWTRLIALPPDKASLLVANVVNGPDSTVDPNWTKVISQSAASGRKVLGYVRSGYLGISWQTFTTRLRSSRTADWVSQIEEDVDQWYRLYPGNMGDDNEYAKLYQFITQSTKKKYPGALTVLNPGTPMPQCFEQSADTLLTYEGDYDTYTGEHYIGVDWAPCDSRKLWHIIFNVPGDQVSAVAALALSRGAGMVEITNDVLPNPYDNLPDDAYMQTLVGALSGGTPLDMGILASSGGSPAAVPAGLAVASLEYTSVSLTWNSAANAVGYKTYANGVLALSLPATMTAVTIGGLSAGTSSSFAISALGGDGGESALSNSNSSITQSLPHDGQAVSITSCTAGETSTTYQAVILVPYAFTRVFIWEGSQTQSTCSWESDAGWPINYNGDSYVCCHYMVEGGTLYKYSGKVNSDTVNAPWAWTWVAEIKLVQNGYDYTWTFPIGTSTLDTSKYVIQVQGYGPFGNIFHPCPELSGGPDGVGKGRYCV